MFRAAGSLVVVMFSIYFISQVSSRSEKTKSPTMLQSTETKRRSKLLYTLGAVTTLVGLALGLVSLIPHIDVSGPDMPPLADNPLTSSFVIENSNIYPIKHIQVGIDLCVVATVPLREETPTVQYRCHYEAHHAFIFDPWARDTMAPGERYTIVPDDAFHYPAPKDSGYASGFRVYADIGIFVSYQPWFIQRPVVKVYRFQVRQTAAGTLKWFSEPL